MQSLDSCGDQRPEKKWIDNERRRIGDEINQRKENVECRPDKQRDYPVSDAINSALDGKQQVADR